VAHRAYGYGWTRNRFGDDRYNSSYSRERPAVERIGKKYQWLALDELLTRLADNYWLEGEYGSPPKFYRSPLDLGFERDIDPTIIDEGAKHEKVSSVDNTWAFKPWILLETVDEARLRAWPFEKDPARILKQLPLRVDPDGASWLVLYEHQSQTEKYVGGRVGEHGLRMQEFRFLATILVKLSDAREVADTFKSGRGVDIQPAIYDMTDEAFLHEAPWRETWGQDKWLLDQSSLPIGVAYAQTVTRYGWEAHLDAALPEGYSSHLPTPWLAIELGLHSDFSKSGIWRNTQNEIVFREFKGDEGGTICLLRSDFAAQLVKGGYTFLSLFIAERNAWPGGSNRSGTWRRAEGVCWRSGSRINSLVWHRDTGSDSKAK
jgi:hypothetical protein